MPLCCYMVIRVCRVHFQVAVSFALIDLHEQSYYHEKFSLKCNTIKQLWSNLNQIFSLSKTKTSTNISELLVNNVSVTAPKDICDHLNNYFCSVGEKLAANIKKNKNDFVKYRNKQSNNSMFCDPITPDEICSIDI